MKIKILLISYPYFADYLKDKLANESFEILAVGNWHSFSFIKRFALIRQFDLVHFYGTSLNVFDKLICKILTTPCFTHYIGTDTVVAKRSRTNRLISRLNSKIVTRVFSGAPWLSDELNKLGIRNSVLVLPAPHFNKNNFIPNMPASLTILVYLPKERESFYGFEIVKELIKNNSLYQFHILMNDEEKFGNYSNVTFFDKTDKMDELYGNCSVLLRILAHDGYSAMVVEALSFGRYVIRNYKTPHCYIARDIDEIQHALHEIAGKTEPNHDGVKFVQTHFSEEIILSQYRDYYKLYV